MARTRTQVGIVGAGPAGLLLAHLLHREGIDSVVLERASRTHVEERIRAGVLEHGTVELLEATGVGARMRSEGLVHHGIELRFAGKRRRIALTELTGRSIVIYGQQEVVKDLIAARLADGAPIHFEVDEVKLAGWDGARPSIRYLHEGAEHTLDCDFIAGCDGFQGVCRQAIPQGALRKFSREYPFAWLGILAAAAPATNELIYAHHERGFALCSMRSREVTRLYLQCAAHEDLALWPDERIWSELHARLGSGSEWRLNEGAILQRGVTNMRSYVGEPMRHGRLFLAGDAAHIVPPTGAKGLNLAVNDVRILAHALASFYAGKGEGSLEQYSPDCLERVWRAEYFSWWMTSMLHRFDEGDAMQARLQVAQLDYVTTSRAAATSLAENYVG